MRTAVILGTGREGRRSELVAEFVLKGLRELGIEAVLVDVRDYPIVFTRRGNGTPSVERFRGIVESSSGLVIVSPEYNRSYPGELKLLLDTLYDEYAGLPVGIVTVSAGRGGSSALSELRLLCLNLGMLPVAHLSVHNVDRYSSADELARDHSQDLRELASRLVRYARGTVERRKSHSTRE